MLCASLSILWYLVAWWCAWGILASFHSPRLYPFQGGAPLYCSEWEHCIRQSDGHKKIPHTELAVVLEWSSVFCSSVFSFQVHWLHLIMHKKITILWDFFYRLFCLTLIWISLSLGIEAEKHSVIKGFISNSLFIWNLNILIFLTTGAQYLQGISNFGALHNFENLRSNSMAMAYTRSEFGP